MSFMQISMHNWMRAEPIEVTIARLARCGYDAIEISGEPERYDTKHVRKLLQDHKLTCWGSVTLMLADRDLLAKDEAQRAASVKYVRDCITMVKELGGVEITIVPSTVGKIKPQGRPEEEWKWAVASLKSCYEHGQREGVRLAIEPLNRFETYFINRHDQALRLAEEVGEGMSVVLDAFHINIEEVDPMQAIRNVGDKLIDFHVADNNRKPAGQGKYDWGEVISTLKSINYQGHLTAEFVLTIDRTPLTLSSEKRESDMEFTEADLKFIQELGSGLISAADYDRAVEANIKHLRSVGA
jgi:D-psicose/D-tagatose/L-ribulose 3-epimerase